MPLLAKLPRVTRHLLAVPVLIAALSPAPLLLGATGVQSAPLRYGGGPLLLLRESGGPQAGGHSLANNSGPLGDTCNSSDPDGNCELDDFVARCDAAGGGLSTEPGGGVDCDTSGWE